MRQSFYFIVFICLIHSKTPAQNVIADFTIPDTVCINSPVTITNKSVNASSFFWNFCVADLNQPPVAINMGNIGGAFSLPVFMDYGFDNGNYYGFVTNYSPGGLTRLDFGNSLLNTPTATSLGNFGGALTMGEGTEGLQIVNNEGKWYAIIVGGNTATGYPPRIVKIEFGTSLSNPSPIATNWGNLGNMDLPLDLHVFKEGSNWYGLTLNAENNSITRFDFTGSFNAVPTATNLGNLGNLAYPTGIFAINDNGFWRVFVVNGGNRFQDGLNSSLTRLDFGSSLLNNPLAVNLGNPGGQLKHPRDISIIKSCDEIVAFAVNGKIGSDEIIKLDFGNDLSKTPSAISLGNIGNLNFPHSISKLFRVNNDLFAFITNVANNTLTRLSFAGCTNSAIPNSSLKDPPPVTYNVAGTYNINLTIDDGKATQSSVCKKLVVAGPADFSFDQDPCNQLKFNFSTGSNNVKWDFGDGITTSNIQNVQHIFPSPGSYKVTLSSGVLCPGMVTKTIDVSISYSDVIKTNDTTVCNGNSLQLKSDSAIGYCWSPTTGLSNPTISSPVAKPAKNTTYYLFAKTRGKNVVKNGDFENGYTGFSSDYFYTNDGFNAGVFYVGGNLPAWHPAMPPCKDHTSAGGNMMMVNGADVPGIKVWSQIINVNPSTNYEFSCWLQHITTVNPASLQFSINGVPIGNIFRANSTSCIWDRFFATWNSGSATSCEISIINMNTEYSGNDFALDDISFVPILSVSDSVRINVDNVSVKAIEDTSVCEKSTLQLMASGAGSYSWSPASGLNNSSIANPVATISNSAASYVVTGLNANGCKATDTVNVSVLSAPVVKVSNDTSICRDGLVQLNASGGVSYKWFPTNGLNDAGIANPIAKPLITTAYSITVAGANGCFNTDSVTVTIMNSPSLVVSNDTSFCGSAGVAISASGANSYLWSPSNGLSDPAISNPVASPTVTTVYRVEGKNNNLCSAVDSVLVKVFPAMSISISGDSSVCQNSSAALFASGGIKYQWTPVAGLSNPNIANPVASPAATTLYSVKVTNSNNCSESKNVTITVLPVPPIKLSNDTILCRGASVSLQATGGNKYLWSPAAGLNNIAIANPIAAPAVSTVYKVTVTGSNNCVNTDSVRITIKPDPVFGIKTNNLAGCAGEPIQLTAFGGDRYEWSPQTGLSDPSIANPIARVFNDQIYSVVITESGCRKSEAFTVPIRIDTVPAVLVSKSNDISCNTPFAQLSTNVSGVSYQWTPAGSLTNATIANPVATPAVNTTYTVSITGINGCNSTGSVEVKAINNNDFRLYQVANSFTPNSDGLNDCFGIAKWGSVNIIEFLVFNRWGQVVFAGNNSNPCWDGNFKGVPQQAGNFVYKLTAQTNCGVIERKGNVVLIR